LFGVDLRDHLVFERADYAHVKRSRKDVTMESAVEVFNPARFGALRRPRPRPVRTSFA